MLMLLSRKLLWPAFQVLIDLNRDHAQLAVSPLVRLPIFLVSIFSNEYNLLKAGNVMYSHCLHCSLTGSTLNNDSNTDESIIPRSEFNRNSTAPDTSVNTLTTPTESGSLQATGNQLFARVEPLTGTPTMASRITGMLLELPSVEHTVLLLNDEALRNRVNEARALLTMADSAEREQR